MSTSATIRFITDQGEALFLHRGHDGYPDTVIPDIDRVLNEIKGRWDGAEVAQLIALFLALTYKAGSRLHDYEPFPGIQGWENCVYYIGYKDGRWQIVDESYTGE